MWLGEAELLVGLAAAYDVTFLSFWRCNIEDGLFAFHFAVGWQSGHAAVCSVAVSMAVLCVVCCEFAMNQAYVPYKPTKLLSARLLKYEEVHGGLGRG